MDDVEKEVNVYPKESRVLRLFNHKTRARECVLNRPPASWYRVWSRE